MCRCMFLRSRFLHDTSVLRAEDLEQSHYITQTFVMVFFKVTYKVFFHTTSRPPHWYSKSMKRRLCWRSKPVLWDRAFSLTWSTSMLIHWNKRKFLHKKRVQLSLDWFGTPTWPPFHCFGTPIRPHDVM